MNPNTMWYGANVMITGVSGSLGSALSRELLHSEYKIARLAGIARKWQPLRELDSALADKRFRAFLGDVRDLERLRVAFRGIDYVFHTAAIKDVVLGEYSPTEVLLTNCNGTVNVLQAAMECGVKKVVVISSDKAAGPINTYGASKRMAESLTVAYNAYSGAQGTRYSVARYGNVVGSAGSVIPIFREQAKMGTLTLTHAEMTRFWITMPDAVRFIMRSMRSMVGGETYVPKLKVASLVDLARAIAPEAELEFSGIRPGEKLHEVMVVAEESRRTQDLGWAYCINPEFHFWSAERQNVDAPFVQPGWVYSSATAERMTPDELAALLEQ